MVGARASVGAPGPRAFGMLCAMRSSALVLACLVGLSAPRSTHAQTVADIAARGACSTAGVEAISLQLAEAQMCLRPGAFVAFAPHAGISLSSSRVHPFLQATARDALHRAAARIDLTVNSAFRTVADQYVLYHSGGCGLAATPGNSNHQSGRALDIGNYTAARSILESEGCAWLGSSDPVHFDCPGSDQRPDSVLSFQTLWNVNNPGDTIAEDGRYGPMTEARLGRTPAGGFAMGACGCEPGCDGNTVVGADCSRADCAAGDVCSETGGAHCETPTCPATGTTTTCASPTEVRTCTDGAESVTACADDRMCFGGECLAGPCDGVSGTVCADANTLVTCAAGAVDMTMTCPAGCVGGAGVARCATEIPDAGPAPDAGMPTDAFVPEDAFVAPPSVGRVIGGCGCRTEGSPTTALWWLLAAVCLRRRVR